MATMNIKDPEVRLLAEELARRRNTTMTAAVRQALLAAVQHDRRERDDYIEQMSKLARETRDASKEPLLTDDDLYDHWGLPR
jgi:hypothetical protein